MKKMNCYLNIISPYSSLKQRVKSFIKVKRKETLIEQHTGKMKQGLSILEITSFQQFLTSAERVIERLQQEVMFARQQMNLKKLKLEEKNIEVKKYEKLKRETTILI